MTTDAPEGRLLLIHSHYGPPPGLFTLVTKPSLIGSAPVANTMGILMVAAFAASAAGLFPTITETGRLIMSATSDRSRSDLPSAERYSTATFWPST